MGKVLNFGSLNLDYVYAVDHLVRTGETLASSELSVYCGGKGLNQSIAAARAGLEVCHAGVVGNDGELLLENLKQNTVDTSFVRMAEGKSGHAIIQVDASGQNSILLYGGTNQRITQEHIDMVFSHFTEDDYLLIQNEISCVPKILHKAKEIGMTIVLNPSPINQALLQAPLELVDIFILNEVEGEALSNQSDPLRMLECLLKRFPQAAVTLTLGDKGAYYQDATMSEPIHQGIFPTPVIDTTAAGDTFIGYFMSGLLHGNTIAEVLKIASKASSMAVSRKGASPSIPTMKEVMASFCDRSGGNDDICYPTGNNYCSR